MQIRTPTLQSIAWFVDLHRNGQLDLSPPYQRLSFWNQAYREFFVDTLLNGYPVPPVYLHQEIAADGRSSYHIVDGKQRIETILMFAHSQELAVPESVTRFAGRYFADLPRDDQNAFWTYQIPVEFLVDTGDALLREVFDRINRNVGKLRRQELRHAKYDGAFAALSETSASELLPGLPNISAAEKRRMRDVEYAAQLLLLLAHGPISTSQDDLDQWYATWDPAVPDDLRLEQRFAATQASVAQMVAVEVGAFEHSRFKNLADYYGLFGAVASLVEAGWRATAASAAALMEFSRRVEAVRQDERVANLDPGEAPDQVAARYYAAVRSASNDAGPRGVRIATIEQVLRAAGQ